MRLIKINGDRAKKTIALDAVEWIELRELPNGSSILRLGHAHMSHSIDFDDVESGTAYYNTLSKQLEELY